MQKVTLRATAVCSQGELMVCCQHTAQRIGIHVKVNKFSRVVFAGMATFFDL